MLRKESNEMSDNASTLSEVQPTRQMPYIGKGTRNASQGDQVGPPHSAESDAAPQMIAAEDATFLTVSHRISRVLTVPMLVAFILLCIQLITLIQYVKSGLEQMTPLMQKSCIGIDHAIAMVNEAPAAMADTANELAVAGTNKLIDATIQTVTGAVQILGSVIRLLISFLLGTWKCLAQAALTTIGGLIELVVNNALTIAQAALDTFNEAIEWIWNFQEKVRQFVEELLGVTWSTPPEFSILHLNIGSNWGSGIQQVAVGSVDAWINYAQSYIQGFLDDAAEDIGTALNASKLTQASLFTAPSQMLLGESSSVCDQHMDWTKVSGTVHTMTSDFLLAVLLVLICVGVAFILWHVVRIKRLHRTSERRQLRVKLLLRAYTEKSLDMTERNQSYRRHLVACPDHPVKMETSPSTQCISLPCKEDGGTSSPSRHDVVADTSIPEHVRTMLLARQLHQTYALPLWLARWVHTKSEDLQFYVHYCWHPPAFACVALGIIGVLILSAQISIIHTTRSAFYSTVAPMMARTLIDAQNTTMALSTNTSAWIAAQINDKLSSTTQEVNTKLLTPLASVSKTVHHEFASVQTQILDEVVQWTNTNANFIFFGQTFIPDLINGLYTCMIGSKLQLFEEALTIIASWQLSAVFLRPDQLQPQRFLSILSRLVDEFNRDVLGLKYHDAPNASPVVQHTTVIPLVVVATSIQQQQEPYYEGGAADEVFERILEFLRAARLAYVFVVVLGCTIFLQGGVILSWRRWRRLQGKSILRGDQNDAVALLGATPADNAAYNVVGSEQTSAQGRRHVPKRGTSTRAAAEEKHAPDVPQPTVEKGKWPADEEPAAVASAVRRPLLALQHVALADLLRTQKGSEVLQRPGVMDLTPSNAGHMHLSEYGVTARSAPSSAPANVNTSHMAMDSTIAALDLKTEHGSEILQRPDVLDLAPAYATVVSTVQSAGRRDTGPCGLNAEQSEVAGQAKRIKPIEDDRLRSILASYHTQQRPIDTKTVKK